MLCLARAYGDEPLKRVAIAAEGGLIYIVNPSIYDANAGDDGGGVGFPVDCVFAFDEDLFTRLRSAYEAKDRATLWALWHEARPFAEPRVHA